VRVLLIEDERLLADALAQGLRDNGFAVQIARDGWSGYLAAVDDDFDVIVLDIMLPRLNGYEVCRRLRAEDVRTPILVLTAKDGEYDEADALDLGADDFLRKPFSYPVLVARLHALLRRSAPDQRMELSVRDLRLDPASRRAERDGRPIELTPREFALLEYLMHHAGETVSKLSLLEHVWGAAWDRDANLVEVYVGYLRKKVDRPFDVPLIETVRGHGYRLVADA
jgi:two-component system, OmpR family, response regulator